MMNTILDKTEKGRNEIATRSHHLASRLRTLLLLVDGKTPLDNLLTTAAGLGMNRQHVQELIDQGFVTSHTRNDTVSPEPIVNVSTVEEKPPGHAAIQPSGEETMPAAVTPQDAAAQIQAAHQFYNETIKAYIGLRGVGLQLKVERAATLDDYRALRRPFLEAVLKHKGEEVARTLHKKLHSILYAGESQPIDTTQQ